MRSRRLTLLACSALTAVSLAACTSSDGGAAGSSAPSSAGPASAAGTTATAAELAQRLTNGVAPLTSAHFAIVARTGSDPLTGSGDETLDNGTLAALRARATLPGGLGDVALVTVGGTNYAKLPAGLGNAQKPWTLLTPGAGNAIVAQLSSFVDVALIAASLGNLPAVAGAATSVRDLGRVDVNGTPTTHYALVVDPAKLPGGAAARSGLGSAPIPADMFLDERGRPLRIRATLTLLGQDADTTFTFSEFDAPVTITAPPASLITSG